MTKIFALALCLALLPLTITAHEPCCTESTSCTLNCECTRRCNNPNCPNCAHKEDEKDKPSRQEVQQLAIATLSNMAQSIVSIGFDPHNPTNVATNVTNLVGAFAGFVAQAMRNPNINLDELLEDEAFVDVCTKLLVKNIEIAKKRCLSLDTSQTL